MSSTDAAFPLCTDTVVCVSTYRSMYNSVSMCHTEHNMKKKQECLASRFMRGSKPPLLKHAEYLVNCEEKDIFCAQKLSLKTFVEKLYKLVLLHETKSVYIFMLSHFEIFGHVPFVVDFSSL